ncbi:hypothetical protein EDB83DRAFT_392346 [Lactarius deliciosus]|nr:hypothetical protein EDB83DRAFT_392346 [Lactarius deliciosus]
MRSRTLHEVLKGLILCIGCVFGPTPPCYRTCYAPPRSVNPRIHFHGRDSRRAFVLSTCVLINYLYCNHHQSHRGSCLDLARLFSADAVFLSRVHNWLIVTLSSRSPRPPSVASRRPFDRRRALRRHDHIPVGFSTMNSSTMVQYLPRAWPNRCACPASFSLQRDPEE